MLEGTAFANEFPVLAPGLSYMVIKRLAAGDESATTLAPGYTEFALDTPRLPIFQNLLALYPDRENIAILRIRVQETGISARGIRPQEYGPTGEDTFRILINLRPPVTKDEDVRPKPVGFGVKVEGAEGTITSRRSFATVLPSGLTNISMYSGNVIPGTRWDSAKSLFVVIDICPLRDTHANVADRLCSQSPINPNLIARTVTKVLETYGGSAEKEEAPTKDS